MINTLKKKLMNGEPAIGTFVGINSQEVAWILAGAGYDFLMVDYEHGGMNIETVGQQIMAIKTTDCVPLLRVPTNSYENVKKGLDSGAYGLMFPMTNNAEQAKDSVSYFNYPPKGVRGFGPTRANTFYTKTKEYLEFVDDDQLLLVVQIETKEAVENINEILEVKGVEVAFIGPYDLSFSLGVNGDTTNPLVLEAIDKVLDACERHGVIPGIMTNKNQIQSHLEQGFKFLIFGTDASSLYRSATSDVELFKDLKNTID